MNKLLIVFTTVFISSDRQTHELKYEANFSKKLISIVESSRTDDSFLLLDLFELPIPLKIPKKNLSFDSSILSSSIQCGMPLEFTFYAKNNVKITQASKIEIQNYLSAFQHAYSYSNSELLSMEGNHYKNLSSEFLNYLSSQCKNEKQLVNFEYGCEARAGIVAKFLHQKYQSRTFKLFLKGEISFKIGKKNYHWTHHCVNLLIQKDNSGAKSIVIFDPFLLKKCLKINKFLSMLKTNNSETLVQTITDSENYLLIYPSKLAILDDGYNISEKIFSRLLTIQ